MKYERVVVSLRPNCFKITWHHENWHLEDFLNMGYKKACDSCIDILATFGITEYKIIK
jgi:hypothetical protein